MPVKIFFCYAHEDEELLNKLKTHLKPLERQKLIDIWYDRNIKAGTEWEQEISRYLNEAQIILLLISPDFMASDYCYSTEMKRAIELYEQKKVRVIPIILRPTYWQIPPLDKLQALPKDAEPVKSWADPDKAFLNVTQGIRKVAQEFLSKTKEQWLDEGLAYQRARQYEEAMAAYEQAIHIDPDDARAFRWKGDILYDLNRYGEALQAYKQAIHLDPNHARIHRNIGDILGHLKYYNEALAAYEQAIRLEPKSARIYNDKGNILYGLKRYEEAFLAYEYATKLDPSFAYAYNNKGNVLSRLTRYLEAIVAYEHAIGLNPNYAIAHNNKGRVLYHLGRYPEALAAFEQAISLDLGFVGAYNNMADALERLGKIEEAKVARARVQQTNR